MLTKYALLKIFTIAIKLFIKTNKSMFTNNLYSIQIIAKSKNRIIIIDYSGALCFNKNFINFIRSIHQEL